ncbi:MAG TPA: hypothetical protein DEA08_28290, partial [Planctomycetes bacterium]|nr:hypothetical protein [Planctomycetota bacterium]
MGDPKTKLADHRLWQLPHADWKPADASFTISNDGGAWVTDTHTFKIDRDELGTVDAPATMLLDPRWQYTRLLYYDRVLGGDEQISSLPLLLAGYADKPPHRPTTDQRTTHSNWTMGDDAKKAIQCVPWVLGGTTKPDKESELRFTTDQHTFIKTSDEGARELVTGEQKTPGAERLRHYDLPTEWRSRNWFVRKEAKGTHITDGKFFWELDTVEKVRGTKDAPLLLSLDDIVLYKRDEKLPWSVLSKEQPVALFHHSFAEGTDLSKEGLYLAPADPTPADGEDLEDTRWPASKPEVLGRKANGDAHAELVENYVIRYPDWVRLVICEGSLFDAFASRSVAKDGEDRVVGARAAVAWVDIRRSIDNVGSWTHNQNKAKRVAKPDYYVSPRPQSVEKPFFSIHQLLGMSTPITNRRRDHESCAAKGSANAAVDIGPLSASRVERDPDRAQEHASDQTGSAHGIGRWHMALIRCCGRDSEDPKKERAILFQYFPLSAKFMPGSPQEGNDNEKKGWIKRAVGNLTTRWNGPDGAFCTGRAKIEPRTQPDAPVEVETFRFFQIVPDARAAIRFQVIADVGGRDFMNSAEGVTQSSSGKEKPQTTGRFTAAHEMGHGGGLLDDYCEIWNHASYYQPALAMLVPGDPYTMDDRDGAESMMLGNKELRARHYWHLAEWLRPRLGVDLQVRYGTGDPYFIPHHPRNSVTTRELRSYSMFPYDTTLDAGIPQQDSAPLKSRFDSYLYPLGKEAYSQTILPGKCGTGAKGFDALLIVSVHIGVDYLGTTDHDWVRATTAKIVAHLRKTFGFRAVAKFTCGGQTFERCLIFVSPRIIVGTHAGNEGYDKEIGAKPETWASRMKCVDNAIVAPPADNGFLYQIEYVSSPGPGSVWLAGNSAPAWPTVNNATVTQGQVRYRALTKPEGRKRAYAQVIKKKIEQNQLHCVIQVGAPTSEVSVVADELPRLKIQTGDLTEIVKSVEPVGRVVEATVEAANRNGLQLSQDLQDLEDDINDIDADINTATNERNTAAREWRGFRDDRNLLEPRTTANAARYDQLTRRMGR